MERSFLPQDRWTEF